MELCIGCHHPDPNKQHSLDLGPPLAGSSFELIKLKVLNRSYPKGYEPKRNTQIMGTSDLSEDRLRGLHAYINRIGSARQD